MGVLPQYAENQSFVNMFLNEARLSATLHHPNIAQVYDIGVENGDYFFSMEYVHGEDLGRTTNTAFENGGPISLDSALTLIVGLCAGLHYAHEKAGPDGTPLNVVHRDVSPSNVLVSYEGGVKLVDFGIARAGSQPAQTKGGLEGKIAYMSPEQCRGKTALDRRSDVFSIGTILYELTTGQLPFTDETEYGVLNQIVNTDAAPPSTVVPSYPAALEAIVMKALARDVEKRYATAQELQGQLEDFAHENRLRISPLVLARLMSTLFPARLEEWDHARAQGAFFVEQHVVRTLIESGKTSDNSNVAGQLAKGLGTGPSPAITTADDETTAVTELGSMDDMADGGGQLEPVGASPSFEDPAASTAAPPAAISPKAAGGGVLVSSPSSAADSAPIIASPSIDRTERVRVPTPLPTRIDEVFGAPPKPSRRPLVIGALVTAALGAVVAVVMLGGSPAKETTAAGSRPEPANFVAAEPIANPVAANPVAAEPVAAQPAGSNPVAAGPVAASPVSAEPVAADPVAAEPVATKPAEAIVKPVPVAKSVAVKRPKPPPKVKPPRKPPEIAAPLKPEPKPKKEPAWNDDSPFMPVRTEKR